MTKYLIDWSINGTTEIEAANADDAQALFDGMDNAMLAETTDEREQLDGPSTAEERAAEIADARERLRTMLEEAEFQRSQQAVNELPGA